MSAHDGTAAGAGAAMETGMESSVQVTREGRGWRLRASQWLPRPVDELWPFFADAYNLEQLTPSLLRFEVLTPAPIEMRAGALIDYRLRIRGVPARWRTEISVWEPGRRFVDRQLRGPYVRWEHEHVFTAERGGTRCEDSVLYEVPGWVLAPVVNALAVQRDVEGIFRFRAQKMRELFGTPAVARAGEAAAHGAPVGAVA